MKRLLHTPFYAPLTHLLYTSYARSNTPNTPLHLYVGAGRRRHPPPHKTSDGPSSGPGRPAGVVPVPDAGE